MRAGRIRGIAPQVLAGRDTKSICQGDGEGQSCFVQGIGAAIWGKIDRGGTHGAS